MQTSKSTDMWTQYKHTVRTNINAENRQELLQVVVQSSSPILGEGNCSSVWGRHVDGKEWLPINESCVVGQSKLMRYRQSVRTNVCPCGAGDRHPSSCWCCSCYKCCRCLLAAEASRKPLNNPTGPNWLPIKTRFHHREKYTVVVDKLDTYLFRAIEFLYSSRN